MARIEGAVVVITGASSGIGRATALAFARRTATVVLASRREDVLQEVARQCYAQGGQALAVPTDVTNDESVRGLAQGQIRVGLASGGVLASGGFGGIIMHGDTFKRVSAKVSDPRRPAPPVTPTATGFPGRKERSGCQGDFRGLEKTL